MGRGEGRGGGPTDGDSGKGFMVKPLFSLPLLYVIYMYIGSR